MGWAFMRTSLALIAPALLSLSGAAAFAQDDDTQSLLDRLSRVEREVGVIQRQVYRGVAPSGAPVAMGTPDNQVAANDEVRFGQIDEAIRGLTGQVEELKYGIDKLNQRLDKLSSDDELRFRALEQGGQNANIAEASPGAPPVSRPPSGREREGNSPPPPARSGSLGTLGTPPVQNGTIAATAPGNAQTLGSLPNGSQQQQYDEAFGLLREANYPAAEQALRDFVRRYPSDPLSGNAQYWLGETYFVRGRYDAAAAAFAEGYEKYPHGAKGADDLLKLGASLSRMGRKADACPVFARLDSKFPIAPANIKGKEAEEKKNAGCG